MFNLFKPFDIFKIGYSGSTYSPLINYAWSNTFQVENKMYAKNIGSSGQDLQQFFGQGCWFNGIDQRIQLESTIILPIENTMCWNGIGAICNPSYNLWVVSGDITWYDSTVTLRSFPFPFNILHSYALVMGNTSLDLYENGIKVHTITSTLSFAPGGARQVGGRFGYSKSTFKDVYAFARQLTQTEIEKYTNQPNQFFMDSLEDGSCVLAMPMCETSSTVRNYKTGTDHAITNYTSSVRDNAKNLQYGLQTCNFVRNSLGVIQSASDYLVCDGVGYANTGWISPLDTEAETIEIIFTEPLVVQDFCNKIFSQTGSPVTSVVEIALGTKNSLTIRYRGATKTSQLMSGTTMLTLVASSDASYIYFNGSLSVMGTKVKYTTVQSLLLGELSLGTLGTQNVKGTSIRLFKVHNKVLTQEEVTKNYNSYVAKGLLS